MALRYRADVTSADVAAEYTARGSSGVISSRRASHGADRMACAELAAGLHTGHDAGRRASSERACSGAVSRLVSDAIAVTARRRSDTSCVEQVTSAHDVERREPDLFWAPLDGNAATSLRNRDETLSSGSPCGRGSSRRFRSAQAGHEHRRCDRRAVVLLRVFGVLHADGRQRLVNADRLRESGCERWRAIAVLGSRSG